MSITAEKKQELIKEFGTNEGDTGSADVQVAILTERINNLTEHMKTHKKDFAQHEIELRILYVPKFFAGNGLMRCLCESTPWLNALGLVAALSGTLCYSSHKKAFWYTKPIKAFVLIHPPLRIRDSCFSPCVGKLKLFACTNA